MLSSICHRIVLLRRIAFVLAILFPHCTYAQSIVAFREVVVSSEKAYDGIRAAFAVHDDGRVLLCHGKRIFELASDLRFLGEFSSSDIVFIDCEKDEDGDWVLLTSKTEGYQKSTMTGLATRYQLRNFSRDSMWSQGNNILQANVMVEMLEEGFEQKYATHWVLKTHGGKQYLTAQGYSRGYGVGSGTNYCYAWAKFLCSSWREGAPKRIIQQSLVSKLRYSETEYLPVVAMGSPQHAYLPVLERDSTLRFSVIDTLESKIAAFSVRGERRLRQMWTHVLFSQVGNLYEISLAGEDTLFCSHYLMNGFRYHHNRALPFHPRVRRTLLADSMDSRVSWVDTVFSRPDVDFLAYENGMIACWSERQHVGGDAVMIGYLNDAFEWVHPPRAIHEPDSLNHSNVSIALRGDTVYVLRALQGGEPYRLALSMFPLERLLNTRSPAGASSAWSVATYPTPATDYVTVSWHGVAPHLRLRLEIFDMLGRSMHVAQIDGFQSSMLLPLSSLPQGVYTILLRGRTGIASTSFVKLR